MQFYKLLERVKELEKTDKVKLLQALITDPEMAEYAYDPYGLRGNFRAAQILQEMSREAQAPPEPQPQ